jgi:hypothetical protein
MSYDDDYDDVVPFLPDQTAADRAVRRRSSKGSLPVC